MEAIAKNKDQISAVVFWGTTDDQSWRSDRTPLLFDETYKAKPCFYAITDNIDYVEPKQTTTSKVTTTTLPQNKDFLRGDVNCDKDVDVSDAVLLARFLAEDSEATVTDAGLLNADANADKKTDQKDVTKILAVLAKLETMPE